MRIKLQILLSLLLLSCYCKGQTQELISSFDTLDIIESHLLNDEKICYQLKDGYINFSRELTIQIWSGELERREKNIDSTTNAKEWEKLQFERFSRSLDYVKSKDSLVFTDPWELDTIYHPKQIDRNIVLLSSLNFYDIACKMLSSGDFKLVLLGKEVKKIIKAEVYEWDNFSGQRSIKYFADEKYEIWICPPVIHDTYSL